MNTGGIQTQDFLTRLQKAEDNLPPLLLELARVMEHMIREIDNPQLEDIRRLHEELRQLIGDAARLRDICGSEGKLCSQCPFGAYLPSGFPYASEKQALCLPWIVVVHPMPSQPPDATN
ncbi:MAG: hypothetical protein NTW80_12335 [Deltaproteobacteria bacterium]|nr:hypothetical protein [Deltaproteobacteria bacterium]